MSEKWKIYDRGTTSQMCSFLGNNDPCTDFLCEIDVEPDIHDHIKINGVIYSVCVKSFKTMSVLAHPIQLGGSHDTDETNHAVCPHCGHEDIDCFEWHGDEDQHACGHCSLPFNYIREVIVSYTTTKIGRSRKKILAEVSTSG